MASKDTIGFNVFLSRKDPENVNIDLHNSDKVAGQKDASLSHFNFYSSNPMPTQLHEAERLEEKSTNSFENMTNITLIIESAESNVYRVSLDSETYAVKTINSKPNKVNKLDNELQAGKKIVHPIVRKSLLRTSLGNTEEAIIMEWIHGTTLKKLGKLSLKNFLLIARDFVPAVAALHSAQLMHHNLTTDHVLVNSEILSTPTHIIGLSASLSLPFSKYQRNIKNFDTIGDPQFFSPERTCRINRLVDVRSDLYSLGVIFYFMLSGKLPFQSDNIVELIHMHIFQNVQTLHVVDPSISVSVSNMVSKLMAKNAEDKYQSTKGLLYDLDLMTSEYETNEKLDSIVLGQHDFSDDLLISQKLHGRSSQLKSLFQAFDSATKGSLETVL